MAKKKTPPDAPSSEAPERGGTPDYGELAVVLSGGGALAAYQIGVLRYLARQFPGLRLPIITGVSAGAINAALLAQHHGTLPQAVEELSALWMELTPERIFQVDVRGLVGNMGRWGLQLAGGGVGKSRVRGLVDTAPLQELLTEALKPVDGELTGIDYNLHQGTLRAVALATVSYTTGQTVIWAQGRDVKTWERPQRRSVQTRLRVEHVMASAALPLFFPAVRIGDHWYGDGAVGLTAPLSPALHLGAHKILTISTRRIPTFEEADVPHVTGYPPPAEVLGVLYDAVFLDVVDEDVGRMERMNELLRRLPEKKRGGLRIVELLVLRPSCDLAALASAMEFRLPRTFRLLTRGLGTRESERSDVLSMIMFQREFASELIRLGEEDAEQQGEAIAAFVASNGEPDGRK